MTAVDAVLEQIAKLSPEDRAKVREKMDEEIKVYSMSGADVRDIYEAFAPIREETKDISEEEIDDFLSEVIAEVREERRAKSGD